MLMVWVALYYVLLSIWATLSPPVIIANIAGLLPFWVVYTMLLLNTGFCLWRRFPALVRELGRQPLSARGGLRWRQPVGAEVGEERVADLLRKAGYALRAPAPGGLVGARGRFGALGTLLFHAAFFAIAVGFFLTSSYAGEARATVAEGEEFTGEAGQVLTGDERIAAGQQFRVDRVRPEFWRDQLLFTELSADVTLRGGTRKQLRINRPLWMGWGTFLRLTSFGWAPAYQLLDERGNVIEASVVKMNVFPSGQRDHFRFFGFPHRVYVEVYPDAEIHAGMLHTRSFNLVDPTLFVRVSRGKVILEQARLRPGEEMSFEGLRLRFPEVRYYGEFTFLYDPGAPVLLLGFLVGFFGVALRVRGRRAEIRWEPGPDGQGGDLCGYGVAEPPGEEGRA